MTESQPTLPPREDRPLVTFALFAYNQEKYIREAIEGAFAQTYEPLEIILSDDCSTDQTFELMRELAADYQGPHHVILRREPENQGLIGHVNHVLALAKGAHVAMAAGDDVSLPDRVSRAIPEFLKDPDLVLLHSSVVTMTSEGLRLGSSRPPITTENSDLYVLAKSWGIYIGATGVINAKLVRKFGPISQVETYEDLAYGFRAALAGRTKFLDCPLVLYRKSEGISSQFARKVGDRLERRRRLLRHRIATLEQRRIDILAIGHAESSRYDKVFRDEITITIAKLQYHSAARKFFAGLLSKSSYAYFRAAVSETKFICTG